MRQPSYLNKNSKPPKATPHKGHWKEHASIAALVIALITAALSYFGRVYYGGYNSFWGLPEDLFSLSQEQSIMGGVVAYLLVFTKVLVKYVLILFYAVTVLILLAMFCCIRRVKDSLIGLLRRLFHALQPMVNQHLHVTDNIESTINKLYVFLFAVGASVFLVLAIAQTSQWASEQGKAIAEQNYKSIISGRLSDKPFPSRAVLLVKNESKGFDQYSGHLIQISATHCALYQARQGVTIFPVSNICRMIIRGNVVAKGF